MIICGWWSAIKENFGSSESQDDSSRSKISNKDNLSRHGSIEETKRWFENLLESKDFNKPVDCKRKNDFVDRLDTKDLKIR